MARDLKVNVGGSLAFLSAALLDEKLGATRRVVVDVDRLGQAIALSSGLAQNMGIASMPARLDAGDAFGFSPGRRTKFHPFQAKVIEAQGGVLRGVVSSLSAPRAGVKVWDPPTPAAAPAWAVIAASGLVAAACIGVYAYVSKKVEVESAIPQKLGAVQALAALGSQQVAAGQTVNPQIVEALERIARGETNSTAWALGGLATGGLVIAATPWIVRKLRKKTA